MEVIYYNEKVKGFIRSLDAISASRTRKTIGLLEEYGNLIGMPDSKSLGGGLFELRTLGKKKVRILYIFHNGKVCIIHGFIKKAWKIDVKDIKYARRVQKEINKLA
ncbi:MAG: type II toxin-antitoxin system RelE/ParE family toxin [Patescibacteria group bacterium]